jgi:indole-3-glycerol phosphate synthase
VTIVPFLTPPGILGEIVTRTEHDLRSAGSSSERLSNRVREDPVRDFAKALGESSLGLIAEYKRKSPSAGSLNASLSVEDVARLYQPYASAISVLCNEPYFDGHFEFLARMRKATDLPLLCKEFIISTEQIDRAFRCGADAVLLMASLLPQDSLNALLEHTHQLEMEALVEIHTKEELDRVAQSSAKVIGINSRNLDTMKIDLGTIHKLAPAVPASCLLVAESGMKTKEDVDSVRSFADGVLIGSSIMGSPDITAQIEELGWQACK